MQDICRNDRKCHDRRSLYWKILSLMSLLLGPPGSGKTSLLLALAGKLDSKLEVSGKITYNGHEMHEFVPRKTSAYISQNDLDIGEMTVRETLDFSARCQGVGTQYEMLKELSRREVACCCCCCRCYHCLLLSAACKNAPESGEAKRAVDLLYDTALISSGYSPDSPADLGNKIYEMMAIALGGRWGRSEESDATEESEAASTAEASETEVVEPSEVRAENDPWSD